MALPIFKRKAEMYAFCSAKNPTHTVQYGVQI